MIIMFNYWSKSGQKDKNSLKIKKNALKPLQMQEKYECILQLPEGL
jgi:hypothetical protein